MNKQQNELNGIQQPTVRPSQRLTRIVAFMLACTVSGQAWAGNIKGRFSDPDITATAIPACPDGVNGCSFEVSVLDFSIDAFVCGPGGQVFPDGTADPSGCVNGQAHFDTDITLGGLGQLEECTNNGSCKLKITDVFTLNELAAAINASIPGGGQEVATFVDTYETCPALDIRAMTVAINGFVCNPGGLNPDGSCAGGTQGSYYNANGVFDPLFDGLIFDDLCLNGNFNEPATVVCSDGTAPYTCSTTYPN